LQFGAARRGDRRPSSGTSVLARFAEMISFAARSSSSIRRAIACSLST